MKLYEEPPAEISHTGHHEHKLKLMTTDGQPFRCNGCMEPGDGKARTWYKCGSGCADYDLHMCCALAEIGGPLVHPFLGKRRFDFLIKPTAPANKRTFCDACGEEAGGFVYHSDDGDLDLHPCCATLKENFYKDGYSIKLCKKAKDSCHMCHSRKGRNIQEPWAYRLECDGRKGYLHVGCMKNMASQIWKQHEEGRYVGSIVEASVPIIKGNLRNKGSAVAQFLSIVEAIGSVIIAVITGNPVAMITAVTGPVNNAIRVFSDRSS